MKIILLSIFLGFLTVQSVCSQDLLGFETANPDDKTDYKSAEPKALESANFLLNTALDESKPEREKALNYLGMWMDGTPDYVFYVDENIYYFTHSNKDLLAIFLAALTKNVLEHKELAGDRKELKYRSLEILLDYCLNPDNHVKPYNQLEKLEKARQRGEFREYVK
ncbi:MAG: hypothetical protein H6539_07885 [Bacteroidales bacterium]|nr:hypothetical protein [Bacteroidales bacterium]